MLNTGSFLRAATAALALGLTPQAAAVLVYVTSYDGTLTSLRVTLAGPAPPFTAEIEQLAVNDGCAPQASWLTLDKPNNILYCVDEDFAGTNGSLSSYKTSPDGVLTQIDRVQTPGGPVAAALYGAGARGIALAEYGAGSVSTYLKDPSSLALVQEATWSLAQPGANPSRQDKPHPHEVILDPTGRFFLVPDLGADLVRVFKIDQARLTWTPVAPLVTPAGSGPRHVSFVVAGNKTYMYLTSELANTVTGYAVTYSADESSPLKFEQVFISPSYGPGSTVPSGAAVSEVITSPDHRFVLVSTRSDKAFTIPNFDRSNATQLVSDSITTFKVDPASGRLSLVQLFPSGGQTPRQFTINRAGTLLGVGEQGSARVVFINRDVVSGNLTGFAGAFDIPGQVTCVVFDE